MLCVSATEPSYVVVEPPKKITWQQVPKCKSISNMISKKKWTKAIWTKKDMLSYFDDDGDVKYEPPQRHVSFLSLYNSLWDVALPYLILSVAQSVYINTFLLLINFIYLHTFMLCRMIELRINCTYDTLILRINGCN